MLQWIDNFQQYGTNAALMLNGLYAESTGTAVTADPDVTATGNVLKLRPGATSANPWVANLYRKVIPTIATVGVMQRIWLTALPSDTNSFIQPLLLTDSNNAVQLSFVISPIGTIKVYRGGSSGTFLGESTTAIVANAWQHVEIKAFISATVGTVEIRVEGTAVLTLSGQNTQATAITTISNVVGSNAYISTGGNADLYVKDLAIWDSSAGLTTNFLGLCAVYSMRPDSDVSGAWTITGGAGSGWASINESTPDDDTKYVSSPFPAAVADVFTVTDLPASATTVKGMMAMVRSRKSDGGTGNLQVSLVSGATTGNGSNRPITTAYTYWIDIFETDPATSAQWTLAAANAVKIKLDRTA